MQASSASTRQTMGCAYEAPLSGELLAQRYLSIPTPTGCRLAPTVCPGYTTSLPEVIEISRARLHWSKGGPSSIGVKRWQESEIAIGIETLESESNECQTWMLENPIKKEGK